MRPGPPANQDPLEGLPRTGAEGLHRQDADVVGDEPGQRVRLEALVMRVHEVQRQLHGVEEEALAITGLSLEIRAEIEKLREQVQNIE